MEIAIGYLLLLLGNIAGFVLPALVVAWIFTLVLPIPFDQAMWLSFGTILAVSHIIQNLTDVPGKIGYGLLEMTISVAASIVLLALAGLLGWLLLVILPVDLTSFEATLLFTISLVAQLYFLARAGTVGLPRWMTLPEIDLDEEDFEDEYVIPPPKKRSPRKKRTRNR